MSVWIKPSVSPKGEPMVEINVSEEALLAMKNILAHAASTYTHGKTLSSRAYAESVRECAYSWTGLLESAEQEATTRIGNRGNRRTI